MQSIVPYLLYKDCDAALNWLGRAFGFEEVLRYTGAEGYVNHAEMKLGDARIFIAQKGGQIRILQGGVRSRMAGSGVFRWADRSAMTPTTKGSSVFCMAPLVSTS